MRDGIDTFEAIAVVRLCRSDDFRSSCRSIYRLHTILKFSHFWKVWIFCFFELSCISHAKQHIFYFELIATVCFVLLKEGFQKYEKRTKRRKKDKKRERNVHSHSWDARNLDAKVEEFLELKDKVPTISHLLRGESRWPLSRFCQRGISRAT